MLQRAGKHQDLAEHAYQRNDDDIHGKADKHLQKAPHTAVYVHSQHRIRKAAENTRRIDGQDTAEQIARGVYRCGEQHRCSAVRHYATSKRAYLSHAQ